MVLEAWVYVIITIGVLTLGCFIVCSLLCSMLCCIVSVSIIVRILTKKLIDDDNNSLFKTLFLWTTISNTNKTSHV